MSRMRDQAAYQQVMREWVVPEGLHVPIVAVDETAIVDGEEISELSFDGITHNTLSTQESKAWSRTVLGGVMKSDLSNDEPLSRIRVLDQDQPCRLGFLRKNQNALAICALIA